MDPIGHILVPIDFSPCSRAALERAVFLARRFGATLEALHVWHPPPTAVPQLPIRGERERAETVWEWSERQAAGQLDEFLEELESEGCELTRTVIAGDPGREILHAIGDRHIDLVVMGTHGRTGLAHVFLGSLAERIVRRAECPVLTVRATRQRARATSAA